LTDTILAEVPLVSMKGQAADPDGFAQQIGRSFERFGFAMVSDHGVDQAVVDRAWAMTKAFFALPEADKRAYFIEGGGGARGYTPFKTEIAKGASHVDLKEFWHVGRELAAGHRFADRMAANVWPDKPEGFRETFLALFEQLDRAGDRLLSAIARYLGLAPNWFDPAVADGNSVLRLLHYPPVPADAPERPRRGA
jgi:isopenicillin N synthase-like dioxygenase